MPELLLYLLKVNVALVLFYLAYHVALRRLTFYHLNRLFLVFGIVFSTVYPFIDLAELFSQHEELALIQAYAVTVPLSITLTEQTPTFDYWQIPLFLFWIGTGVMAFRLLMQFFSLYRIHASSEPATYKNIPFREIRHISQAFSFWRTIYLNPTQHKEEELESILRHELIHIKGWHTLDVLLAELSTVFYWFNPGVWLMKKAVKENLEFIADQNVVNTGVDKREYQYLLLKVVGATQPQIANQFNFPSLKRRIATMNKMPTSKAGKLRLLIALPLIAVLLFAFKSASEPVESYLAEAQATPLLTDKTEELPVSPPTIQTEDVKTSETTPAKATNQQNGERVFFPADIDYYQHQENLPENYKNFLKRNPTVEKVGWKVKDKPGPQMGPQAIVIRLKSGKTETYNYDNNREMVAAENKYGKLPDLFPPPPPVRAETPGTPPPPPAEPTPPTPPAPPAGADLPTPPPPFKHDGPLIPATGAKLVEDEKAITYVLWPGETNKREFEVAKNAFKESGFDLNFDTNYSANKLIGIKITLKSNRKGSNANAVYNTNDLDGLKESNNVIVVKANKLTGELIVGSTIAKK